MLLSRATLKSCFIHDDNDDFLNSFVKIFIKIIPIELFNIIYKSLNGLLMISFWFKNQRLWLTSSACVHVAIYLQFIFGLLVNEKSQMKFIYFSFIRLSWEIEREMTARLWAKKIRKLFLRNLKYLASHCCSKKRSFQSGLKELFGRNLCLVNINSTQSRVRSLASKV